MAATPTIWGDQPTARQLTRRLDDLPGIGQKKSARLSSFSIATAAAGGRYSTSGMALLYGERWAADGVMSRAAGGSSHRLTYSRLVWHAVEELSR